MVVQYNIQKVGKTAKKEKGLKCLETVNIFESTRECKLGENTASDINRIKSSTYDRHISSYTQGYIIPSVSVTHIYNSNSLLI